MPQKPRAEAIDELQALGEALILREICNEMIDFACPDPNSQTSGDEKDDDILSITDECDVSDSDSDRDTDDGLWSDAFESELSSVVELRRHLESRRYLAPRTKRTKGADVFATFAAQIDEAAFKQEYRVSCANFSRLVSQLETHPRMCRQSDTGAFRYPAAHRIAVGLKRLGSAAWLETLLGSMGSHPVPSSASPTTSWLQCWTGCMELYLGQAQPSAKVCARNYPPRKAVCSRPWQLDSLTAR